MENIVRHSASWFLVHAPSLHHQLVVRSTCLRSSAGARNRTGRRTCSDIRALAPRFLPMRPRPRGRGIRTLRSGWPPSVRIARSFTEYGNHFNGHPGIIQKDPTGISFPSPESVPRLKFCPIDEKDSILAKYRMRYISIITVVVTLFDV